MGVTHLWTVLAPVKQRVTLSSLRGQTLAVDLGLWICEMQFIQHNPMSFQTPYLRTLYFRILKLAQCGVKLVFVVDGEASHIKLNTMLKRFKKDTADAVSTVWMERLKSRRSFRSVQKQCCQLLDALGIPHMESEGEGEKLCAILNQQGLVDGVITNDGDAFLYGASKVYRNLSLGDKEPSIEMYDRDLINDRLRLTREHLITFGILVGCDYMTKGVPGIGKENALRFLRTIKKPLHLFNQAHKLLTDSTHCVLCKHNGTNHSDKGCAQCKSSRGCNINSVTLCSCTEHTKLHSNNHQIVFTLERCTLMEDFPFKPVVKEFIDARQKNDQLAEKLRFTCLSAQKFKAFASLVYMWDDTYCLQQAMNIAVAFRWNFKSCLESNGSKRTDCICGSLVPLGIIKARKKNYESCLEVQWSCPDNFRIVFETLSIPDGCKELRTVESIELLKQFYPDLVREFESAQCTKKPRKKKTSKVVTECELNKENEMCIFETEQFQNEQLNDSLKFLNLESPSKMRKTLGKIDTVVNRTPKQVQTSKKVTIAEPIPSDNQVKPRELVKSKKNCVQSNQNTLKRLWCPSPSGDGTSLQPVRSAPRITSTPYRTLMSPASFFEKRMVGDSHNGGLISGVACSPIKEKDHAFVDAGKFQLQTVPSPYLNVEQRQRKSVRVPVKPPPGHVQKKLVVAPGQNKAANRVLNKLLDSDSDADCSSDSSDIEAIEVPMPAEREQKLKQEAKRSRDLAHKLVLDDSDDEKQVTGEAVANGGTSAKQTKNEGNTKVNPANGMEEAKKTDNLRENPLIQKEQNQKVTFACGVTNAVRTVASSTYNNDERKEEVEKESEDDDIICLEDIPLIERLKLRKASVQS